MRQYYWSEAVEPKDFEIKEYVESIGGKDRKFLCMEGLFQTSRRGNRNTRYYPEGILERETNRLNQKISESGLLCEMNHPMISPNDPLYERRIRSIDSNNACAIIRKQLRWDGTDVMGSITILDDDGGPGQRLASQIRHGFVPGVSSRAVGGPATLDPSTGLQIIPDDLEMITYDVVETPSVHNARLQQMIAESLEFERQQLKGRTPTLWAPFEAMARRSGIII